MSRLRLLARPPADARVRNELARRAVREYVSAIRQHSDNIDLLGRSLDELRPFLHSPRYGRAPRRRP